MKEAIKDRQIVLYLGPNTEENERTYDAIIQIPDVSVSVVRGVSTLADYVPMPYIDGDDGLRYYGKSGIDGYLKRFHTY